MSPSPIGLAAGFRSLILRIAVSVRRLLDGLRVSKDVEIWLWSFVYEVLVYFGCSFFSMGSSRIYQRKFSYLDAWDVLMSRSVASSGNVTWIVAGFHV